MKVNQIYQLVNDITTEVIGDAALLQEDLSNVVDVGTAIFNNGAFDNYVKSLLNQIGKMVFVDRPYTGSAPSVLMDSWEYGSVLAKISSEMPEAVENQTWELVDGQSYDPHIFHAPKAEQKFFNKRTTFEIDRSLTERQVKESFADATQLNGFISMLLNETQKSLTVKTDSLIMRTINNMAAETIHSANPVRAVNLLSLYGDAALTPEKAIHTPEFIRFAAYTMNLYGERMTRMSTLFNQGGKQRFTPKDMLHFVTLAEFSSAAEIFLYANTYHDELTRVRNSETVPFWQGSGKDFSFANTSAINIKTSEGNAVNETGIIGVMFDRDALGVTNFGDRVTTDYNAKAEFTNYFYKREAGYFNDFNENFIVFYLKKTA